MLANPITLKNYFENDKNLIELEGHEYLVKITKFSTSLRQAIEYAKIIYDMYVRRELIKISEATIDNASNKNIDLPGEKIIEDSEKLLFDLAERGSFSNHSLSLMPLSIKLLKWHPRLSKVLRVSLEFPLD